MTTIVLTSTDENYVDLSNMVEFDSGKSNGCLTIIENGKSPRLRLSPDLYEDLGKPEAVKTYFASDYLVLIPSSSDAKSSCLKKGRYLYNTDLSKKVMKIASITSTGKGSTTIGSYHIQADADRKIAAVISLRSDS